MLQRYVAIGDSFTEGVGDETPGGLRGWADLVAQALARDQGVEVQYANLAIRGRKLAPLLAQQLGPALRLRPDIVTLNGGGNDLLRPRVSIPHLAELTAQACTEVLASGARMVLLSGADPTRQLPAGRAIRRRGQRLAREVLARCPMPAITYVDNWSDAELSRGRYWSPDRMHLNAAGHVRVASNVLAALGLALPEEWGAIAAAVDGVAGRRDADYYRRYVLPWIGRRLTGRSSGDGRSAKHAEYVTLRPGGMRPGGGQAFSTR